MSKLSWRNGFTIGLVTGGCIVMLAILYGRVVYNLARCEKLNQCDRYASKYENNDFPSSWWWLWDGGLVSSKDTLAQWIMTLLTFLAVILISRTLTATREMVDETKNMATETKIIGDKQFNVSNEAVTAAREANEVMLRQARMSVKPWLFVELSDLRISSIGPDHQKHPTGMFAEDEENRLVLIYGTVIVHCIGEMPVTLEKLKMTLLDQIKWLGGSEDTKTMEKEPTDVFEVLPGGSSVKIHPRMGIIKEEQNCSTLAFGQVRLNRENRGVFITAPPPIIGKIYYSDPLGTRYEHRFAFITEDRMWDRVRRYGGLRYNGDREIQDH